jgi:hypothetical protein
MSKVCMRRMPDLSGDDMCDGGGRTTSGEQYVF